MPVFEGYARAQRGLFENQHEHLAGERRAVAFGMRFHFGGQAEEIAQQCRAEFGARQQVFFQ